jgi:hypothetical protein
LCLPSSPPTTGSVKPPARCPACSHKKGAACRHETGELPAWPGTLDRPARDDGRKWHQPGNGTAGSTCSCGPRDDFSRCGSSSLSPTCRRRSPRTSGLILTETERRDLRRRQQRVFECGTRPVSMRRLAASGRRYTERRMTTLGKCGLRECDPCEERRRRRRASRAEGPWTMMLTLTVDPARVTLRKAWKMIPGWIGKFCRAMQRQAEKMQGGPVVPSLPARQLRGELQVGTVGRKRAIPRVLYAWAIEPHASGYPHAHLVTALRWCDRAWQSRTWGRITRNARAWVHRTQLDDKSGKCRYLTKYITKAAWPLDLCAISQRRRLFWSALPLPWSPPSGWTKIERDTPDVAGAILAGASRPFSEDGWTLTSTPSTEHVIQERVWLRPDLEPLDGRPVRDWCPASFDGTEAEWQAMVTKAEAARAGWWNWRWWHDPSTPAPAAMRRAFVRQLAWLGVIRERFSPCRPLADRDLEWSDFETVQALVRVTCWASLSIPDQGTFMPASRIAIHSAKQPTCLSSTSSIGP